MSPLYFRRCYIISLCFLLVFALTICASRLVAFDYISRNKGSGIFLNDRCEIDGTPTDLFQTPINFAFATCLLSAFCCICLLMYIREKTKNREPVSLKHIRAQNIALFGTLLFAFISMIVQFAAHSRSTPVNIRPCFTNEFIDYVLPASGDLETWVCGIKDGVDGLDGFGNVRGQCGLEVATRVGSVLYLCLALITCALMVHVRQSETLAAHPPGPIEPGSKYLAYVGLEDRGSAEANPGSAPPPYV